MTKADDEIAIRNVVETRERAVRDGDVDAMMSAVADDVMIFDVVEPLRREGKQAARERAEEWLASYEGPVAWENRDLQVIVDGDVGFSYGLSHVTGKLETGDAVDMWFRSTLGFRRIDGRWLVVHDHGSEPFDPKTGKASVALKP